ncbi:MAG: GTPase [Lachnospiraceae bacterium]|nr:GTPase [Lachnospiraceae bacterium]
MGTRYFINGFLEAGKTTFIQGLLASDYFQLDGRTLLIVCEEGNSSYDPELLEKARVDLVWIEEEEEFTEEKLTSLEKEYRPERVMIEFNGMWDRRKIIWPWYWDNITEVAVLDATTFRLYSENMRSLLAEQVRNAWVIQFYRSDEKREELASYARNIRAMNPKCNFLFKGKDGDIFLSMNEMLPYDLASDDLCLDDEGFAVFCLDALERKEVYAGKKVHFIACAHHMKDGSEMEFIAGRKVMTCCEADMTFAGIICNYFKAYEIPDRQWVQIDGIVRISFDEVMQHEVPVCRVTNLTYIDSPKEPVISFL